VDIVDLDKSIGCEIYSNKIKIIFSSGGTYEVEVSHPKYGIIEDYFNNLVNKYGPKNQIT
jgi:hypothetical protein